jgi:ABC-type transport system involved in multi-copper enzyme maturation permease subunit
MSQSTSSTRAPHQLIALTIGVVYLLVGAAGFFVTGFDGFAEHNHDQTLLGFAVNPLHNIVHILIGLLGVALWSAPGRARTFGWLLVAGYGATFVFGLIAVNNPDINILNINAADNVLHIGSVVIGLAIALWPQRQASTTSPELERF